MDDIDKKIEQDKLRKSVVKYWNVNYSVEQKKIETRTPGEGPKTDTGKMPADRISGRDMDYNPYTKARSGDYGKQPVEAGQAEVIDSILDEKKFDLDKILEDPDAPDKTEVSLEKAAAEETPQTEPAAAEEIPQTEPAAAE